MSTMSSMSVDSLQELECCGNARRKFPKPKFVMKLAFLVFLSFYAMVFAIFVFSYMYSSSSWSQLLPVSKQSVEEPNVLRRNLPNMSPLQAEKLNQFKLPTRDRKPVIAEHYKSMKTNKKLEKKCLTCAIVSSSGQMLDTKAGDMIDNASCVIRMNHSPTEHYENDVGFRTTIRVVCHMSTVNVLVNAEDILAGDGAPEKVLLFGLNADNHKWAKLKAHTLMDRFPNVDFYSQDKYGELNADVIFEMETGKSKTKTNTWLSTGFYTFLVAIDMCEKIDVYGFVYENYCREHPDKDTKYHYFQTWDKPGECDYYHSHENASLFGGHRFLTEKAVFNRWAHLYNITFHYPSWNISRTSKPPVVDTPWVNKLEEERSLPVAMFQRFAQWAFGSMF